MWKSLRTGPATAATGFITVRRITCTSPSTPRQFIRLGLASTYIRSSLDQFRHHHQTASIASVALEKRLPESPSVRTNLDLTIFNFSTRASSYEKLPNMVKPFVYPEVRRDEGVVDDYHGVKVADPYRWLEDPDSAETKKFVDAQNDLTVPFLENCEHRENIRKRLTKLWDFPKYSCPMKAGNSYFYFSNSGLQNQSVLYVQDSLTAQPRVFLDPNTLSDDGTTAISTYSFSEDGSTFAYALSKSGSDWVSIHFRNVGTGEDYPEVLQKAKFTEITWTHDNLGIFYGRYMEQTGITDGSETTSNENQKLYYHRLGTSQVDDTLMAEFLENPKWRIHASVSDCGTFLVLSIRMATRDNLVYYADMVEPLKLGLTQKLNLVPIIDKFEADYDFVGNDGSLMYFRSSKDAPNYRVIGIDFKKPELSNWTTVLAENSKDVLDWAAAVNGDKMVTCYIQDVKSILQLRNLKDGTLLKTFSTEVGAITSYSGERKHNEFFFNFSSFLTPGRIYHVDLTQESIQQNVFREISLEGFDPNLFTTTQVFYPSKDGTKIPMFIIHKKDAEFTGDSPCSLYGYGGFNISIQPAFSVTRLVFMQHLNGICAVANIRGGGEYGQNWYNGGRLLNKQNVFDDFQAAGEYLIQNKYTNSKKLVIQGGSNGGLLVGACINQRPDLFGAGIAQVGVMDMLRFHKFTIGYAWAADYGRSDNEEEFHNLFKFSPLHNVRTPKDPNVQYPAVLLLTADHDDRVVPLHSLKFIAELQHQLAKNPSQTSPLMIRVETKAGHGAGKPTAKIIDEHVDILSFLVQALDLKVNFC